MLVVPAVVVGSRNADRADAEADAPVITGVDGGRGLYCSELVSRG